MRTVSFGELEDARLVLTFGVTGPGPLASFMGDVFTPDAIELTYSVDSIGEDSWRLERVSISGPEVAYQHDAVGSLASRASAGCDWKDAPARLPAWAWHFAARVDPSKELGYADE